MRADLALERLQLQDVTKRRDDGERVVVSLPWQIVTYPGGIAGLEPVDFIRGLTLSTGVAVASATDKEITGVMGQVSDALFAQSGTGGDVFLPKG